MGVMFSLLAACTGTPALPPPAKPSLLLVTLDTTRADHIGAYGHESAKTPTIDRLAEQGVRFTQAYATVPLTTPSHASIMTGLYPTRHGIRNNGDATLSDEATTLAERLQADGYRTAAAVSAFVTTSLWNLDQGFDAYYDDVQATRPGSRWARERSADAVVDDLLGWLSAQPDDDAPFFVWAHFYDPHHPYQPPPPYDEGFAHPYDGELAFVDSQLARLLAAAEAQAGAGGLAVVVVADHGEAFDREHDEVTHGMFVFDPTMRVPFLLRPAAPLPSPVVAEAPTVSVVDVMPSALGLLGLAPPGDIDGVDLSAAAEGAVARGSVYMESLTAQHRFGFHPEVAAAEGGYKLIDTPSPRLYNVTADPGETANLVEAPEQQERVASLRAFARETWARAALSGETEMAPEVAEQLAALGYVNHNLDHSDAPTIDAKDRSGLIARIESIQEQRQDPAAQEAAFRSLLADEPSLSEARMGLARALSAQGKHAEAGAVLEDALARHPTSTVLRSNHAQSLAAQGRHDEALAEMFSILEQVPGDNIAQIGVLRMLTDQNRTEEGIRYGAKWLEENPGDGGLQAHLGVLYGKADDLERAEPLLRASLRDEVPRQLVHKLLANIEMLHGNAPAALGHLRQEQALMYSPELYLQSARLLFAMEEWAASADDFMVYMEAFPSDHGVRREHAQAVYNTYDYELAAEVLAPALAARPDDPDILLLHANILVKIGDRAEAEAVADRARRLHRERLEAAGAIITDEGP